PARHAELRRRSLRRLPLSGEPVAQTLENRQNSRLNPGRGETAISPHSATRGVPLRWPHFAAAVVMGVSGSGKSAVGVALAERLACAFVDGDTLHPAENVAKMQAGQPLNDADRAPWLAAIGAQIAAWRTAGMLGVVT